MENYKSSRSIIAWEDIGTGYKSVTSFDVTSLQILKLIAYCVQAIPSMSTKVNDKQSSPPTSWYLIIFTHLPGPNSVSKVESNITYSYQIMSPAVQVICTLPAFFTLITPQTIT